MKIINVIGYYENDKGGKKEVVVRMEEEKD